MAVDITKPLRTALARLETEKQRIERQIAAIHGILGGTNRGRTRGAGRPRKRGRKRMTAAERKGVSQRMKAYWAKRRAATTKRSGRGRGK